VASGWRPLAVNQVESRASRFVDLGGGAFVPERFVARFSKGSRVAAIRVRVVERYGTPHAEVEGVEVGTTGRELTPTDPRDVPWGALFDEAVAAGAAFGIVREGEDGPLVAFADPQTVDEAVRRLRRRRGRALTREHLDSVREVAEANPSRPAMAVAQAWGVGRTTASYWIKRASEEDEDGTA
jgi:hypothetical protein